MFVGLLAGLFEFPSIDLPSTSSSTSTGLSKSDRTLLLSFLQTLIKLPKSTTLVPSPSPSDSLRVVSSKEFEPVIHVYSHIIRTYKTIRIVLSSEQLPTLLPASSLETKKPAKKNKKKKDESDDEEVVVEMVKSQPGSGKWIDLDQVENESLGGAFKKIWEVRQGRGVEKKVTKASGKGGKKEVKKEEKGQKSLMGFFGSSQEVGKPKKGRKEESDEEVVIVERKVLKGKNGREEDEEETEIDEGEKKIYKKRRIAPASDEEDE